MDFRSYSLETTCMIAQKTKTRKRTLLVVDDDEGVRRSLEVIFGNTYEILLAEGADEALELLKHHSVDAAVLDIRMAGMSGIELLGHIKTIDPSIEALMLTGYETLDTIRQALRYGACDYLSKPFDVETIRSAVANAMERRSLTEEIRSTHQKMASLQLELQQQSMREEITRNRGEIYASVLHDINGPLTIIAGYIDLINIDIENAHRLDNQQIETIKDHLRLINRQVTQCIEVSRRYLSFLRHKPLDKTSVALNTVFADLRSLLKAHPSRVKSELRIIEPAQEAVVLMNGADLIQVLLNLAVNAFQSTTEPHRVTISAESVPERPDLANLNSATDRLLFSENFDRNGGFIKVSVQDNGPGIPPETLVKIFQPFFTTKGEKGTGLGLSIAQRLVNEAGGAIHVHSEVGKGTLIHLYLRHR